MWLQKKTFDLSSLSKARKYIYGIAILWIVFFHCHLQISCPFFLMIKSIGDCGVELFFLMSGISLYFSFHKNQKIGEFYKRRFIRVIPYYLVFYGVVFVYFNLISNLNVKQFFLNYSMLDYWINGLGNVPWFLAGIFLLYLIYPFVYKLFFCTYKNKRFWVALCLTIILAIMVALSIFYPHLKIFLYRVPIFLFGCFLGKMVYDKKQLSIYHLLILVVVLFLSYSLFITLNLDGLRNLFYFCLSLFLILVMCEFYDLNSRHLGFVNKSISFLGGFTLEVYLTHEKTQENLVSILNAMNIHTSSTNTFYQLACIVLAFLISIGLSKLIGYSIKLIKTVQVKISFRRAQSK